MRKRTHIFRGALLDRTRKGHWSPSTIYSKSAVKKQGCFVVETYISKVVFVGSLAQFGFGKTSFWVSNEDLFFGTHKHWRRERHNEKERER